MGPEAEDGMGLNLASIVTESAARVPDSPAVRLGEAELTYAAPRRAQRPHGDPAAEQGLGRATGSG